MKAIYKSYDISFGFDMPMYVLLTKAYCITLMAHMTRICITKKPKWTSLWQQKYHYYMMYPKAKQSQFSIIIFTFDLYLKWFLENVHILGYFVGH